MPLWPAQVGATQRKRWSASLQVPSLALALLYPEEAGCASPHYAPRLLAELLDLAVQAEVGGREGGRGWGAGLG